MALLLTAVPAQADRYVDPNDVSGRLDIKSVELTFHRNVGQPYMLEIWIRTYQRWPLSQITGLGGGFLADFDSRGSPQPDYFVRMRATSEGPYCELHRRGGGLVGTGWAFKAPRTFYCEFQRSWLEQGHPIRWRISSIGPPAVDYAPDDGWYVGF
jgi:hypothetical protein